MLILMPSPKEIARTELARAQLSDEDLEIARMIHSLYISDSQRARSAPPPLCINVAHKLRSQDVRQRLIDLLMRDVKR